MKMLKAPKFWNRSDGRVVQLLIPFSKIYGMISNFRINSVVPESVKAPVVCIGNIVMGGAGKTPTVDLVCKIFQKHKHNPHILASGYGGYLKNVVRVDPAMHSYLQVGDEALLSARVSPTWVGKNKINSAKAAISAGADILVMDDGFQNNSVAKDLKILVVDSGQEFGNGHLFPAGPLRENIDSGIKKSDIILIIGDKNESLESKIKETKPTIPIFYATMQVVQRPKIENNQVVGFCGLGYPEKFRKTLLECGFEIRDFIAFSDHHPYTITEIQKLIKWAKATKSSLVTTRKDYVKIPDVFKPDITVIDIELVPESLQFEKKILDVLGDSDK